MSTSLLARLLACAAVAAAPLAAHADLAFNVGAVTDYRYRGISQTRLKPAIQAGVDWSNADGFYLGSWASTIKWIQDLGGSGKVELDLYGGYKGELVKDLSYDVGVLSYVYPSNKLKAAVGANANTTEIYGALTWRMFTLKYSHSVTNTFANVDSKNSNYLDLTAAFDIGSGLTLTPHLGRQKITGPLGGAATYNDISVVVSRDFSGLVVSAGVYGTDADKTFYASPANGKFLGRTGLVLGAKYNF